MRWDYLSRLACAARWYLPPAEAEELLEDYRETVRQLVQPKAYKRWLTVFAALTACVLVPMVMARNDVYWNPILRQVYAVSFCLGIGLSLLWFQRNWTREGRLPRGIVILLALILLGMAWVWFLAGLVLAEAWELLHLVVESVITARSLYVFLTLEFFAMGAASLFGLVKARLGDRRWRAVYVLGLSGTILAITFYLLLSSMNFDGFVPGWWKPYMMQYTAITLFGFLGTGLSLR